jgi:AAA+ superfamily predicted ATPase
LSKQFINYNDDSLKSKDIIFNYYMHPGRTNNNPNNDKYLLVDKSEYLDLLNYRNNYYHKPPYPISNFSSNYYQPTTYSEPNIPYHSHNYYQNTYQIPPRNQYLDQNTSGNYSPPSEHYPHYPETYQNQSTYPPERSTYGVSLANYSTQDRYYSPQPTLYGNSEEVDQYYQVDGSQDEYLDEFYESPEYGKKNPPDTIQSNKTERITKPKYSQRKKKGKRPCPLSDIVITNKDSDILPTTDTNPSDDNDNNITRLFNKKKDATTSPKDTTLPTETEDTKPNSMAFLLPIQNKPLERPSDDNGVFSMLFPNYQKKEAPKKTEPDIPKRDRSKFIQGKPINTKISTLDDLIKIGESIDTEFDSETTYSLDLESLKKMLPCLCKLRDMIGLNDIKNKIIHQVLFYLQGLDESNKDMLHTVIEGDPGVGKTEIAKILGEIYCSLGILSKGTFTSVKRADLVGSYLGQTASKTMKVLEASSGGVLFIDEAYSLGNDEGKDIYSKECIDTITAYLSENRENFVCVIAGYKDALQKCFFKHNAGLERRFPWRYSIKGYSKEELKLIFEKIVAEHGWSSEITLKFFENHMDKFKNFGGDMENLFHKSKLAHSMRALSLDPKDKKKITMEDIKLGFEFFIEEEEEKINHNWIMYT